MATERLCWSLSNKGRCRNPIEGSGYIGSGFCQTCYYPEIEADHKLYSDMKEEGHSHLHAAMVAGLIDPGRFETQ